MSGQPYTSLIVVDHEVKVNEPVIIIMRCWDDGGWKILKKPAQQ